MVRLIKTLFVLSIWSFSFAVVQKLAAQQTIDLAGGQIQVSDLELEDQVSSAIDLLGPEDGSAGRNRAALAHRLQCWIDGTESCSFADLNDPRVRAIRRFLGKGLPGRHGVVFIHCPDQTRVEVHLERRPSSDFDTWTQSAYQLSIRSNPDQAPELPAVPSGAGDMGAFAPDTASL